MSLTDYRYIKSILFTGKYYLLPTKEGKRCIGIGGARDHGFVRLQTHQAG